MKPTVLITNASGEIGKATAVFFAEHGWNVAAVMTNPEQGKDLLQFKSIKVYKLDTLQDEMRDIIEQILLDFSQLDVLIHNVCLGNATFFENTSLDFVKYQFHANVIGFMNLIQEILPHYRSQKKGQIVTILPSNNTKQLPFHSIHNAISQAISGFTESLSQEVLPLGIQLKLFDLPILQSDFYKEMQAEDLEMKENDYKNCLLESRQKFQHFLQNSSSVKHIPAKIYQVVQTPVTKLSPKNIPFTDSLMQKLGHTLHKIAKKK